MKIKGVIDELKIKKINLKNDNIKNISMNFSSCCGQCGDSSVSDSSLFQFILLKICRSLPL